jgi:threonine dehydratase
VSTLTRDAIAQAASRLAGWVRRTPVIDVVPEDLGLRGEVPLVLKLELLQHSGSFKARGAHHALLARRDEVVDRGVVAASGGNFGLAVAHAAGRLGVAATIFVPDSTAPAKLAKLRTYGASVEVVPGFYADAFAASEACAASTGAALLHAYDQVEVVAGQGTVGVELEEQVSTDRVVLAVGGAGLIGGVASWFEGDIAVTGVETEGCPTLSSALAAGEPVDVDVGGLAADSLGARRAGALGFAAARRWVDRVVPVTDDDVVDAQRRLWSALRVAAEPGGAAALAALTSGKLQPDLDERVAVVICGGNVDPATVT